jgi:hypothetical protein
MRDTVPIEFPAGYDGSVLVQRLARVLDPELDESIRLRFVRCPGCVGCHRGAAAADQLVRGQFRLSDGGGCSARAAERRGH